jgi:hypothetical protein
MFLSLILRIFPMTTDEILERALLTLIDTELDDNAGAFSCQANESLRQAQAHLREVMEYRRLNILVDM